MDIRLVGGQFLPKKDGRTDNGQKNVADLILLIAIFCERARKKLISMLSEILEFAFLAFLAKLVICKHTEEGSRINRTASTCLSKLEYTCNIDV